MNLTLNVWKYFSRCRNSLLDGNIENYDWEFGYTCHQLSSGAIVVQLAQPYVISSMRMLLWDCDERSYSYYIETSVNDCRWDLAVDRTREMCRYVNNGVCVLFALFVPFYRFADLGKWCVSLRGRLCL